MRAREERLLPNVVRASFPPEAGPHGVASHPPPSYVVSPNTRALRSRTQQRGVALGALDTPGQGSPGGSRAFRPAEHLTSTVGRYFPGQRSDWPEFSFGSARQDYALLADGNRPYTSAGKLLRTGFGDRKMVSRAGKHGKSIATVVLTDEARPVTTGSMPGPQLPGALLSGDLLDKSRPFVLADLSVRPPRMCLFTLYDVIFIESKYPTNNLCMFENRIIGPCVQRCVKMCILNQM